jgi:hypothetical protein
MFGFSEVSGFAWSEYPPIRTTFALIARVVIVPAIRIRAKVAPAIAATFRSRPR